MNDGRMREGAHVRDSELDHTLRSARSCEYQVNGWRQPHKQTEREINKQTAERRFLAASFR